MKNKDRLFINTADVQKYTQSMRDRKQKQQRNSEYIKDTSEDLRIKFSKIIFADLHYRVRAGLGRGQKAY